MIAVISGSSGLVGALLIQKLLEDNAISQVISISRKTLELNHKKLTEVIAPDLSKLHDYQDLLKGDIYFCCLGTTIKKAGSQENFRKIDFDAIVRFGKVAEMYNAQSLTVISAMGANANSSIFYNKVKGETEKGLMELKLNRLILLRPALLMGERKESRPLEKGFIFLMEAISPLMSNGLKKKISTKVEDLANRMLKEGKNTAAKIKIINAEDI